MSRVEDKDINIDNHPEAKDALPPADDKMILENMEYPVLSLRDIVVFPENSASLFVGRSMSLKAAKAAYQFGTPLALLTQKQSATEDPKEKDLYQIGTLARIKRFITMPDGTLNLAVEGIRRIRVKKLNTFGDYYTAFIEPYDLAENGGDEAELKALAAVVSEKFRQQTIDYSKLPKESLMIVNQHENLGKLIAVIIGNLDIKTSDKQELLECRDERAMLTKLLEILNEEGARIAAENKIKDRVKSQMEKNQRDYYLNEQLKAIQKELTGVENEEEDELQQYAKKIAESKMSKEARAKANQELKNLRRRADERGIDDYPQLSRLAGGFAVGQVFANQP